MPMQIPEQEERATFLESYAQMWERWRDFSSITTRNVFWKAFAVNYVIQIVIVITANIWFNHSSVLEYMFTIVTLVPLLAMCVRRMHDAGHRGTLAFIYATCIILSLLFGAVLGRHPSNVLLYAAGVPLVLVTLVGIVSGVWGLVYLFEPQAERDF
ncbi:DUF805 domain-containing protein [Ferrimicrobium acidiphilum]|uniref:DUF805 domain-containing protein n=1 Tax=Ferrimicrobium acidiphilum TaxID=121039 RepID=UPI0023F411AE|nr:DUF805 domain-containing protein [Ferrimicrobium acidiphilum]